MKIVVIGGTGLIGRRTVALLEERGHEVLAASPSRGIDAYTGAGLEQALAGAQVVLDVTNAKDWEEKAVLDFFTTTTRNLLKASAQAGVGHYLALSVAGAGRVPDSGYLRAKSAQEALIRASGLPYTIVGATQFFEFVGTIAHFAMAGGKPGDAVRMPAAFIQPIAAADVSAFLADCALAPPRNATVELGGPERFRFAELVRLVLPPEQGVVEDPQATYFGSLLAPEAIVPATGESATGGTATGQRFADWQLAQSA